MEDDPPPEESIWPVMKMVIYITLLGIRSAIMALTVKAVIVVVIVIVSLGWRWPIVDFARIVFGCYLRVC